MADFLFLPLFSCARKRAQARTCPRARTHARQPTQRASRFAFFRLFGAFSFVRARWAASCRVSDVGLGVYEVRDFRIPSGFLMCARVCWPADSMSAATALCAMQQMSGFVRV